MTQILPSLLDAPRQDARMRVIEALQTRNYEVCPMSAPVFSRARWPIATC